MIVRRGRQHPVWELAHARLHPAVEFGGGAGELPDIETDVVARNKPAVAVEGGILHGLGAQWCAQLLVSGERDVLQSIKRRIDALSGKPFAKHVREPCVTRKASCLGTLNGLRQDGAI